MSAGSRCPVDGGKEDTGTTATRAVPTMSPVTIANARWFLPGSVIVSAAAAGTLGLAFRADRLLVVLLPLVPIGYALAVIDARAAHLLPRRLVVPATLAVAVALVAE